MTTATDLEPAVTFIKARVQATPDRKQPHDIGWLPSEGWFCTTCATHRCTYIRTVRDVTEGKP